MNDFTGALRLTDRERATRSCTVISSTYSNTNDTEHACSRERRRFGLVILSLRAVFSETRGLANAAFTTKRLLVDRVIRRRWQRRIEQMDRCYTDVMREGNFTPHASEPRPCSTPRSSVVDIPASRASPLTDGLQTAGRGLEIDSYTWRSMMGYACSIGPPGIPRDCRTDLRYHVGIPKRLHARKHWVRPSHEVNYASGDSYFPA